MKARTAPARPGRWQGLRGATGRLQPSRVTCTGGRKEEWRSSRMEVAYVKVPHSGGKSAWALGSIYLEPPSSQALLGLRCPCTAHSAVACSSWLLTLAQSLSGWGRGGLGITHFVGLVPSTSRVPRVLQSIACQADFISGERAKPSSGATAGSPVFPHPPCSSGNRFKASALG